ncbi:hypothetical protein D3C75_1140760 [compost metagenome]
MVIDGKVPGLIADLSRDAWRPAQGFQIGWWHRYAPAAIRQHYPGIGFAVERNGHLLPNRDVGGGTANQLYRLAFGIVDGVIRREVGDGHGWQSGD